MLRLPIASKGRFVLAGNRIAAFGILSSISAHVQGDAGFLGLPMLHQIVLPM